jgi:hypothetical protein
LGAGEKNSADDILHRQCKNMLNNLNVLVKVLDNLVGTLAIQQQQRCQEQEQEKIVENVEEGEKMTQKLLRFNVLIL